MPIMADFAIKCNGACMCDGVCRWPRRPPLEYNPGMSDEARPESRWYHPTPGKLVVGLLVVELCLLLADRFSFFGLKQGSGWNVLLAVAIFGVTILLGVVWFGVSLLLRRRFQFGIITLFLLMGVVAVVGGWFSWKSKMAKRQAEAAAAIQMLGGYLEYDYESEYRAWAEEFMRSRRVKPGTPPPAEAPGPEWLRNLVGVDFLADVVRVRFYSNEVSLGYSNQVSLGLEHLRGLPNLTELNLSDTTVTDAELMHLEQLTKLEILELGFTKVTDAGLGHLKRLTNLTDLDLSCTEVTNAGLVDLGQLTKLEVLNLGATVITDAGLEHLEGLTNLEKLDIFGTQVSDEGIKELQQVLPNCEIFH